MREGSLTKCLRKYPWDWPVINHLRILRAARAATHEIMYRLTSRDRHEIRPQRRDEITPGASLNELLFFIRGEFSSSRASRMLGVNFRREVNTLPLMIIFIAGINTERYTWKIFGNHFERI